jgi:hypothetical protein
MRYKISLSPLCLHLTAQLTLNLDERHRIRVRPERFGRCGLDRRQGLAGHATVAVELLKQPLGARDAKLGHSEVCTGDDALEPVRLGKYRKVGPGSGSQLPEFCAGVLFTLPTRKQRDHIRISLLLTYTWTAGIKKRSNSPARRYPGR